MTVGSNACPTVTRSSDSNSNMDVGAHLSSVKALSSKLSALGADQWPERSRNQTPQLGWPSGSWHWHLSFRHRRKRRKRPSYRFTASVIVNQHIPVIVGI